MNRALIAPSLMCISSWNSMQVMESLENCGVDLLHMDVMDGEFVPNLMLGTEAVKQMRRLSAIPLDIHLMIERPEEKLAWFEPQPGEYVSVHVESTKHLHRAISRIRECGARPMVALNPLTPLVMIEEALPCVDAVLLMVCDQPLLTSASLMRLLESFVSGGKGIACLRDQNHMGNPAVFASQYYPQLLALEGDRGAKGVLRAHADDLLAVHTIGKDELADADTPQALDQLRSALRI